MYSNFFLNGSFFICGFSTQMSCAFKLQEQVENFQNLIIFKLEKRDYLPYILIRLWVIKRYDDIPFKQDPIYKLGKKLKISSTYFSFINKSDLKDSIFY